MMELFSGNPDGAIRAAKRTLELDPDFVPALTPLATAYAEKSMLDEAVEVAERANRTPDPSSRARALLAEMYARAGRREDALGILEELRHMPIDPRDLAVPYAALGALDEAFAWMDQAVDSRSIWAVFLDFDPAFAPLRGDPRFEALRKRIGLPGVRG